jgi:hypothetical protein
MIPFWDIAQYSLVEVDRRFRGAYCLHHQAGGNSLSAETFAAEVLYAFYIMFQHRKLLQMKRVALNVLYVRH